MAEWHLVIVYLPIVQNPARVFEQLSEISLFPENTQRITRGRNKLIFIFIHQRSGLNRLPLVEAGKEDPQSSLFKL